MAPQPGRNTQTPDNSILDYFNRQCYLGNQWIYSIGSTELISMSETPIILLSNPANTSTIGSFPNGKSLFQGLKKLTCITTDETALFRFYSNPTITDVGTTQTPVNLRPASPNTSIANLSTSPTASSFGSFVAVLASGAFTPDVSNVLTILDPGNSLLVTAQASSTSTFIAAEISWAEF